MIDNDGKSIILYGSDFCGSCVSMKNLLREKQEVYKNLNIEELDADTYPSIKVGNDTIEPTSPSIIVIQNDQYQVYEGVLPENLVAEICSSFIADDAMLLRPSDIIEVDFEFFLNSTFDYILYVGRDDCPDCQEFYPILRDYLFCVIFGL